LSKLAIVILNWNGKHWLEKFLPGVVAHSSLEGVEIYVADNGSFDNSLSFLQQNFPTVKCIDLGENHGYAGGYNRALIQIKAEYFLLLNSDIEVVENWLQPMLQRMDNNPSIGAMQPKILWHTHPDTFEYAGAAGGYLDKWIYPFCRGRIFDTMEKDHGQYDDARPVFWATGACLLVRASAFFDAGMLDDDLFAHMEEIDLCWRMQHKEYEVWVEPASVVYHVGGGTLHKSNPRKTFLNFRNNLAIMYKNLPANGLWLTIFVRMVMDGLSGIYFMLKGNFADTLAIVKAHFAFYAMLKKLQFKRKNIVQKPLSELEGTYSGSIVWQYFARKKRFFSEME
jgi:GT2 family glycosyltransferase